ncbi:CotD family spore coat protein [Oceanobacillus sp. CFH 90083]|uniref:CotD family spore coat protein n=1 Tax=Oceanobacillus sp. CFH 90083 TaxID=2592336 RepID=UPI00128C6FC0|nr:CotD family spore coat protein [Oceanobacillus sp. CFH 90083]
MQGKREFHPHHLNEKTIVHPTRHRYVHTSSGSVVNHIHPVHTTYVHHHMVKHPHSPGYEREVITGRPPIGPHAPFRPGPLGFPGQMPPEHTRGMRSYPGIHPHRRPGVW